MQAMLRTTRAFQEKLGHLGKNTGPRNFPARWFEGSREGEGGAAVRQPAPGCCDGVPDWMGDEVLQRLTESD